MVQPYGCTNADRPTRLRRTGYAPDAGVVTVLQDHVKATIAPYKYPREVAFVEALPKTATGKLQRFALRER
jgi:2-aminobenzoate-CoA ligase